mmetsp:Transcript_15859/g.19858  ORF Transcript_15859/g.19858 Transcript_15859/m.19858 type:complete len:103 (+) Transcript_15859:1184-1492(+)
MKRQNMTVSQIAHACESFVRFHVLKLLRSDSLCPSLMTHVHLRCFMLVSAVPVPETFALFRPLFVCDLSKFWGFLKNVQFNDVALAHSLFLVSCSTNIILLL